MPGLTKLAFSESCVGAATPCYSKWGKTFSANNLMADRAFP